MAQDIDKGKVGSRTFGQHSTPCPGIGVDGALVLSPSGMAEKLWERARPWLASVRRKLLPDGTRRQTHYHELRVALASWYLGPLVARAGASLKTKGLDGRELSVVVLSLDAQAGLVAAVRSLAMQTPAPEIIVVNSGASSAATQLEKAGLQATVIESSRRLFPGAARNLGIAASHGQYIAFLAADCIALPGWVARRLHAHHAGSEVVSSPVINANPWNPFASAAHILLFASRLPGTPVKHRQHYGASYRKGLFTSYGFFSHHLRAGEDTEFHQRLPACIKKQFAPRVLTAHRNPTTLIALLKDQYLRGRRRALASEALGTPVSAAEVSRMGLRRSHKLGRIALQATPGAEWPQLLWALPWTYLATLAYARFNTLRAPVLLCPEESRRRRVCV